MKHNTFLKSILTIWLCFAAFSFCGCDYSSALLMEEESTDSLTDKAASEDEMKKDDQLAEGDIAKKENEKQPAQSTQESKYIYVHVCGSVKNPGVYELSAGDRADAAVKAAGGLLEDADEKAVNLAEVLSDGVQVYVPSKEENIPLAQTEKKDTYAAGNSGLINVNSASMEELMSLSGIGESKAMAIIQYREENGRFASIEEIKNVKGIGDGIYEKIKDLVTI